MVAGDSSCRAGIDVVAAGFGPGSPTPGEVSSENLPHPPSHPWASHPPKYPPTPPTHLPPLLKVDEISLRRQSWPELQHPGSRVKSQAQELG